jgi:hypothetical protein
MRKILTLIFTSLSIFYFSQVNKKQNALFTIRGNIGIVRPISSQMFSTCFSGIYEANLSANLRLFGNFYAGVGYQSSYFQNSKFLKQQFFINSIHTSVPYSTNLIGNGAFFKLGYDKFFSDKGYVSYSLNTGMLFAHYTAVNADTSAVNRPYGALSFSAPYLQPEISINFIAEDHLSFSLMFSYTTLFTHFDPRAPRFNVFDEIRNANNRYVMSWINIGFGFNVLIGK